MMRNNRDGTFRTSQGNPAFDQKTPASVSVCSWGDYNGDLWPDLYVVTISDAKTFIGNNGDGTFTDAAARGRCGGHRRRHERFLA